MKAFDKTGHDPHAELLRLWAPIIAFWTAQPFWHAVYNNWVDFPEKLGRRK